MNVLIVGTRDFEDWVAQLIDAAGGCLQSSSLSLRIVQQTERADLIVMEAPGAAVSADAPESSGPPVPRIIVVDADSEAQAGTPQGDSFYLIRGANEVLQLTQLALLLWQRRNTSHLAEAVLGPVAHDVRGAQSVVHLCRQLIDAGAATPKLSPKLERANRKLRSTIETLRARALCITEEFPEETLDTAPASAEDIVAEFRETYPERTVSGLVHLDCFLVHTPQWVALALQGVLDGCGRLTSGAVSFAVEEPGAASDPALIVHVERPEVSEQQREMLLEFRRLQVADPTLIPYRLATACGMIHDSGGELLVALDQVAMELRIQLPGD